ncbi:MAG TPA: L,D-transpeptidase [Allocoleopsis sp.]
MGFFRNFFMLLCLGSAFVLLCNIKLNYWTNLIKIQSNNPVKPPKSSTQKKTVKTQKKEIKLVVDLSDRYVYYYENNQMINKYPVSIGKEDWETPTGEFKITEKKRNPSWIQPLTGEIIPAGENNPLGDRWIGFWSDGLHKIGFHGTNKEYAVGEANSHGCLRMKNEDIRKIYSLVSIGTAVIVKK